MNRRLFVADGDYFVIHRGVEIFRHETGADSLNFMEAGLAA